MGGYGAKGEDFFDDALENSAFIGILFAMGWLTATIAWANLDLTDRCRNAAEAFIRNEPLEQEVSEKPEYTEEAVAASEPALQEVNYEEKACEKEPAPDPVTVEEKARRMKLVFPMMNWGFSDEERKQLLFETGTYEFAVDSELEYVTESMTAYLRTLTGQALENVFDSEADQDLKDEVAEASEDDQQVTTSTEKDQVILVRLMAYEQYGKASLCRLLAEDFHCYALAFQYSNEDRETIVSYYLQSLKWLYECLKYEELSENDRADIVKSIQYRYNDIMTFSQSESEQWHRARLLSDAWEQIAGRMKRGEDDGT